MNGREYKGVTEEFKEERSAWLFLGSMAIAFVALTFWWIGTNV